MPRGGFYTKTGAINAVKGAVESWRLFAGVVVNELTRESHRHGGKKSNTL